MNEVTAEMYRAATGSDPVDDDLERANCDQAGKFGHYHCGWDEARNLPYTAVNRTVEAARVSENPALPDWVTAGLAATELEEFRSVIPGRYPFTYAYDFLRSNAVHFGAPHGMSRGETAAWLAKRMGDDVGAIERSRVCAALALAYIAAEGLTITPAASARIVEFESWIRDGAL